MYIVLLKAQIRTFLVKRKIIKELWKDFEDNDMFNYQQLKETDNNELYMIENINENEKEKDFSEKSIHKSIIEDNEEDEEEMKQSDLFSEFSTNISNLNHHSNSVGTKISKVIFLKLILQLFLNA